MRLIYSFSLLFIIAVNASGQNDPQAIQILERYSAKALEAPSISMKFKLVTTDQMQNTNDTVDGSIILSKDRYKLELPNNIIWFNGETSWSYLVAEEEVTISNADKDDSSFQNRPSSIFSMYKSGYKSRLIEENSGYYIIDLYPEDIKSDLLRVRISIGKSLMDLLSFEYKKRDGMVITLYVMEYNLNSKPEAGFFVFQQGKFKGVEVIDMR